MRSLSPIEESEEPNGGKTCDETVRMFTRADVTENLICVDWLNFEGVGTYCRIDYKVRYL